MPRPYAGPDRRTGVSFFDNVSYRGPDRRGRVSVGARLDEARLPQLAGVLGAALAVFVVTVLEACGWQPAVYTLRVVSGALFLLAGACLLLLSGITGLTRTRVAALGFVCGGALCSMLGPVAASLHVDPVLRAASPACALTCGLVATGLLARAAWIPPIHTRVRPVRTVGLVVLAAAGVLLALRGLRPATGALDDRKAWAAALAGLAAVWAVAAGVVAARRPDLSRLAVAALGLVALAYLLDGWAVEGHVRVLVASCYVRCLAAGAFAYVAVDRTVRATREQESRAWTLVGELDETTRVLAGEHAFREELLHDVRSAVASLRFANTALERSGRGPEPPLDVELRAAFDAELGRLAELVDVRPPAAGTFDLVEVVVPLVRLACDGGLAATLDLADSLPVRGSRRDTATVVHTLLANAARYGGGAVRLRAERRAFDVRLEILDGGPGVAPDEREAVFRRGFRGSASVGSQGSGLGLFVARRLMAAQDGGLSVEEAPGGGACFVLTLPAPAGTDRRPMRAPRVGPAVLV